MIDKKEFDKHCQTVALRCNDPYAQTYARAGIRECHSQAEMRTQALYIVNNIQHWRGTVAKETRAYFKAAGADRG